MLCFPISPFCPSKPSFVSMFAAPPSSPLNLSTAAPKPLSSSMETRLLSVSATSGGSRRRFQIKASVSTFAESIPVASTGTLNLYDVLRVKQTASQTEIKTAYRSLAKVYHPDAVHDDDDEDGDRSDGRDFMEIHNAYETLSDPAARAVYDLSLAGNYYQNRRRRRPVGFSGECYPTRRWETDQCW